MHESDFVIEKHYYGGYIELNRHYLTIEIIFVRFKIFFFFLITNTTGIIILQVFILTLGFKILLYCL